MTDQKKQVTFEELIIEMMPFSEQLVAWCKAHSEFQAALKNIYADKFISLQAIVTSYPKSSTDEVIGIYTYNYTSKTSIFKQDFVVNKNKENKEFILYTRWKSSKYVKDVQDFFAIYGKDGSYVNSHHLKLEQLPKEIKFRGEDAIKLVAKMGGTFQKPPQELMDKIYEDLMKMKREDRYNKIKLKKYDLT
jgi:hypothetical protein